MTDDPPPPAPPRSALTLRLWVAAFGVLLFRADYPALGVLCVVLTIGLVVDFARVVHRKRRGDPG